VMSEEGTLEAKAMGNPPAEATGVRSSLGFPGSQTLQVWANRGTQVAPGRLGSHNKVEDSTLEVHS
jgi:hypothetical protein